MPTMLLTKQTLCPCHLQEKWVTRHSIGDFSWLHFCQNQTSPQILAFGFQGMSFLNARKFQSDRLSQAAEGKLHFHSVFQVPIYFLKS